MTAPLDLGTPPRARLRAAVSGLPLQQIVQIASYAEPYGDVIPLWYGESDVVTDTAVRDTCARALAEGHTFYADKSGVPALRAALAEYETMLHGRPFGVDRITVTASGMSALQIALTAVVDPGSNVALVTPLWPNAASVAHILGAEPRSVPLAADEAGRWSLDLDRLAAAVDERTAAVVVNAPGNPTGWICPPEQQRALLDLARSRRLWLIADEVYGRIVYDGRAAPSFLDIVDPEDPVLVVNSFSKSWAMTGWRLGWLTAPPSIEPQLGNLVEFTTSGATAFAQHGAIAAVTGGEPFVARFRDYCRAGRDLVSERLAALPGITYAPPEGAFYAFFRVEGCRDSVALARRIVREARVGLAPGIAFGPESEGWLRLCFAQSPDLLRRALDRLMPVLSTP